MATKASSPATAHTRVWTRWTGMPRSEARSALVALARTATPSWVRWRNHARATMQMGTTTMAITSLALKTTPPTVKLTSKGASMRGARTRSSVHSRGISRAQAARIWARPEGRHGEDQPRGVAEPADDQRLDQAADEQRGQQPGGDGQPVAPAPRRHQHQHQHGGDAAEVGLGEVEDAVRPVDQGHAQRHQGGEAADDDAPDEDAGRHREQHQLEGDDRQGRAHRRGQGPQPVDGTLGAPGRVPLRRGGAHPCCPVVCCGTCRPVRSSLFWVVGRSRGKGHM